MYSRIYDLNNNRYVPVESPSGLKIIKSMVQSILNKQQVGGMFFPPMNPGQNNLFAFNTGLTNSTDVNNFQDRDAVSLLDKITGKLDKMYSVIDTYEELRDNLITVVENKLKEILGHKTLMSRNKIQELKQQKSKFVTNLRSQIKKLSADLQEQEELEKQRQQKQNRRRRRFGSGLFSNNNRNSRSGFLPPLDSSSFFPSSRFRSENRR